MSKDTPLDNDIVDEAVSASVYADAALDETKTYASDTKAGEDNNTEQNTPAKPAPQKILGLPKPLVIMMGVSVVAFIALILINSAKQSQPSPAPVQEGTAFIDAVEGEVVDLPADDMFDDVVTFDQTPAEDSAGVNQLASTSTVQDTGVTVNDTASNESPAQTDMLNGSIVEATFSSDEQITPSPEAAVTTSKPAAEKVTAVTQSNMMASSDNETLSIIISKLDDIVARIDTLESSTMRSASSMGDNELIALASDVKAIMKTVNAQSASIDKLKEQINTSKINTYKAAVKKEETTYVPPELIWMTWVDGRGIALVEGTSREISIEPGEQLKGRGVVKEVTDSGCITFTYNMPSYAPRNGSCD